MGQTGIPRFCTLGGENNRFISQTDPDYAGIPCRLPLSGIKHLCLTGALVQGSWWLVAFQHPDFLDRFSLKDLAAYQLGKEWLGCSSADPHLPYYLAAGTWVFGKNFASKEIGNSLSLQKRCEDLERLWFNCSLKSITDRWLWPISSPLTREVEC